MATYGTATDGVPPGRPRQDRNTSAVKIVIRAGKQRLSISGSEGELPPIYGQFAESFDKDEGE